MKFTAILLVGVLAWTAHAAGPATLKLTQTIPLPGVKGRFDHFAIDVQARRLFVAALGNNTLEVVDLAAGKRLQSVPGMSKPTGILYLPEPNQILVASGDDGTLKLVDGATFKVVNDLFYDDALKRLYLSCGEGFIDVIDQRSADTSPLRERVPTRPGARTSFFSTDRKEFYLAVPQSGNQPAELSVFQTLP